MTNKEMIEVIQAFEDGKVIELRTNCSNGEWEVNNCPLWNFSTCSYRVKEEPKYIYPMWFKTNTGTIVKFTSLNTGEVIKVGTGSLHNTGSIWNSWFVHTDKKYWTQVEEPKEPELLWYWSIYDVYEYWRMYPSMCTEEHIKNKYSKYTRLDALGSKELDI